MDGINATLIEKCKRSDERALYTLYRQCYSMMKGITHRYVYNREDLQGVMNSGFVKIVKNLDKYDEQQAFGPWATTIMIHESLDYVRRTMRKKAKEEKYQREMLTRTDQNHEWNVADRSFDAQYLIQMLDLLPPQTRTVFNLFAIEGYKHSEISNQLGISEGTSKWHVSEARKTLQKALSTGIDSQKKMIPG